MMEMMGMERSGSTGSGSRSTASSTRESTGNNTGSGSRNTGNGPGDGTGNTGNTGNGTGSGTGSGRAAPAGGAGRALLLCLALLLPAAPALPSPVPARPSPPCHCLSRSRELLEATNATLHWLKELNILGFECTLEEVAVEDITENQINTIRACTAQEPGPGNCPTLERSTFDKGKCLQGISEDVRAYRAQLGNLQDPQLLGALDRMLEALGSCSGKDPVPLGSGSSGSGSPGSVGSGSLGSLGSGSMGSGSMGSGSLGSLGSGSLGSLGSGSLGSGSLGSLGPFPARLRLCAVLQALRLRSVTISRMLSFLSSL